MPKATQCLTRCYERPQSELRSKLPNRLVEWDRRFTWLWRPPSSHFRWDRSLNAKKITDISHIPTRHDRLLNHPSKYLRLPLHCITALMSNIWCLICVNSVQRCLNPDTSHDWFSETHQVIQPTQSCSLTNHELRACQYSANLYQARISPRCPHSPFWFADLISSTHWWLPQIWLQDHRKIDRENRLW